MKTIIRCKECGVELDYYEWSAKAMDELVYHTYLPVHHCTQSENGTRHSISSAGTYPRADIPDA